LTEARKIKENILQIILYIVFGVFTDEKRCENFNSKKVEEEEKNQIQRKFLIIFKLLEKAKPFSKNRRKNKFFQNPTL